MLALAPLPYHRFAYDSERGSWEFLIAPPPPDLAGVVEAFWISRGRLTFLYEKILPQNNVELMFNLEQPFGVPNRAPGNRLFRRAWVAGMQREWLVVTPQYDPTEPSYLLSIRLPPLGAYRLLGMPMGEVAEDVIELNEVLGREVDAVHQQLGETASTGLQFAILCEFARRLLARSRVQLRAEAQAAVSMIADSAGSDRIQHICRNLSISRKHLNGLFDAHIGLPPKVYARMFRFRRVIDMVQGVRNPDWTQIAMSCGYYDQSHFNREFREFSSMTPGEYASSGSVDGLSVVVG